MTTTLTAAQEAQLDHRDNAGRFAPMHRDETTGLELFDDAALVLSEHEPDYPVVSPTGLDHVAIAEAYAARTEDTWYDEDEDVTLLKGITFEEHESYTQGRCGELALALHERTGWPVVVFADGYDPDNKPEFPGWVHAGLETPDGQFLDVDGSSDWYSQWDTWGEHVENFEDDDGDVETVDPAGFARHCKLTITEDDRDVADRVLHAIGLSHLARPERPATGDPR